jgi:hypothetical protein
MSRLWRGNGHYSGHADFVQQEPGAFFARMQEMRLHQDADDQINLKISRSPDLSRFDPRLPKVPKSGAAFSRCGAGIGREILTVRRQSPERAAMVGVPCKGIENGIWKTIADRQGIASDE